MRAPQPPRRDRLRGRERCHRLGRCLNGRFRNAAFKAAIAEEEIAALAPAELLVTDADAATSTKPRASPARRSRRARR